MKRVAVALLLLAVIGVAACGERGDRAAGGDMTGQLREALSDVDRLVVRGVGSSDSEAPADVLLEVADASAVRSMIRGIRVEDENGGLCLCLGSLVWEFYAGDALRESVGFHHGFRLR